MTKPSDQRETSAADEFQQAGQQESLNLVQEFLLFVRENKKWWLAPIFLSLLALAILALFGRGPLAPLIYPFF